MPKEARRSSSCKLKRLEMVQVPSNRSGGRAGVVGPQTQAPDQSQGLEMSENSEYEISCNSSYEMGVEAPRVFVKTEDVYIKSEPDCALDSNPSQFCTTSMDSSVYGAAHHTPSEELILFTENLLKSVMPKHWTILSDKEGFNCLLISRDKDPAIQRNIYVTHTGTLRITVHRKDLPAALVKELTKDWAVGLTLTSQSSKLFVDNVLGVIMAIRNYEICSGAHHLKYESMWTSSSTLGFIDYNPYAESRYSRTFRSKKCSLLVPVAVKSCNWCKKVSSQFSSKLKNDSEEVTSPFTANRKLTDSQKDCKLSFQSKTISNLREQLQRHLQESDTTVSEELG